MIPEWVSRETAARGLGEMGWKVMKDEPDWLFYSNPTYPDDPLSPLFLSFHDGDMLRDHFVEALTNAGIDPIEFASALERATS